MQRRWKVLTLVSIGVFMVSLDLFIVNVAFPKIQGEFHGSSVASVSWVLNAYAIVLAALMVSAGRMADRHGRRRAFLWGLLIFVVGSALCGAAPSVAALVGARIVQAIGAAFLLPTSLALLLPEFEPAERPAAIGIWAAIGGVAAAAGPPIGGLLVQASWRWVFLVNLPIGLVTALVAARVLRESRDPEGKRFPDLAGAALLVIASSLLMLAIVQGQSWGWSSVRIVGLLVGSVVLTAAFLYRSASHAAPVLELGLFRSRAFSAANVASTLFFAAFGAMLLSNVLFLTRVWHEDILTAGLQISPGPIMAAAFAVPGSILSSRYGQRAIAAIGALLFASGGAWWLTNVGLQPNYVTEFLPGMLLGGSGVGLVIPTLASAVAASLPAARFATGSAVYGMTRQFGIALGVAVLVAVLGAPRGAEILGAFRTGWEVMAATAVASAIAAVAIGRLRTAAIQTRATRDLERAV